MRFARFPMYTTNSSFTQVNTQKKAHKDWLANLNWISVVLLVATLVLMTVQFAQAYGGQLPQYAPAHLPAGVLGLDGWADRLIVLSACLWVIVAAWQAIKLTGQKGEKP